MIQKLFLLLLRKFNLSLSSLADMSGDNNSLKIRECSEKECSLFFELSSSSNDLPRWSLQHFQEELCKPSVIALMAFYGEIPVAFLLSSSIFDEAELMQVMVVKELRQRGIANELFLFYLNVCRQRNIKKIFLEVRSSNYPAMLLYEKVGFKKLRVRKDYYSEPVEDGVCMEYLFAISEVK
jgi:ribosomal-protein-alanine N-acetyltransferase